MKATLRFLSFVIFSFFLINNAHTQVTSVNYLLKYDTSLCRFDVLLLINTGSATSAAQRAQLNSQVSLVVPTGTSVSAPINNMPLQGNQSYNGTIPLIWGISSILTSPTITPDKDYISITPSLSPTSFYNNLTAGDTVRIFSFTATPAVGDCSSEIRFFETGSDPVSSDPGMNGGDFTNGLTIGSLTQLYNGNSPSIFPDPPVLNLIAACSSGLEIDLSIESSTCQSPMTFLWSGPDGYSSTDEDVNINPASGINNGTYSVTVTDALGCESISQIDAISKPNAGIDQVGCVNATVSLAGTEPTTGTWTADAANASGASLTPGSSGEATVQMSGSASGEYKFIYTNDYCTDTMSINIASPDAGSDPSPIQCYSSHSVTINALNPTGTWSVGLSSPGTATIADPNQPTTTVNGFSDPGTYYLVWTVDGCSDSISVVTQDICGCMVTDNLIPTLDPSSFCGSSGAVFIDANTPTPVGTMLWQSSLNGGAFSDATGSNTNEDYVTSDLPEGTYTFRRICTITQGGLPCSDTSNTVNLLVSPNPDAPSNLTADPSPICFGESSELSVTENVNATYTWTASSPDAGLGTGTSSVMSMNPLAAGFFTINVTQTVNGCESDPASVVVVVNQSPPTPLANTIFSTNPDCDASNGSIRLTGYSDNTTYTIDYDYNGSPETVNITSNGFGHIIMNNLSAGDYTNFKVSNALGCSSGTYTGTVSLTEPEPPIKLRSYTAVPNPACLGTSITITVNDTTASVIFNWTADSPDAGLGTSTTSTNTMLATAAGFYTITVTQTINGCTSDPYFISISVNDTPPDPTAGSVSSTNPTQCGGTDGTISLSGLDNLVGYTVDYSKDGTPTSGSFTTDASGVLTITDLEKGNYTNFSLTNATGCTSGTYLGPVSLSEPGSPDAPTNLVANPNPICLGTTINLGVDNTPGATYTWSASSPDAGLAVGTANNISMDAITAGIYTISVSQTVAGCTSPTSSISVEVFDTPPTPDALSVGINNPSVCGGTDGSITISGLSNNVNYIVLYKKNGNDVTENITSNGSGIITIASLSAGTYTDLQLSNDANCASGIYAGPISLSDPNAPSIPAGLIAVPNPLCAGGTVNLSVDNNPNATYTWSVSPVNGSLVSSTTNTTTMVPSSAGVFTVSVTQTVAGCTSLAATTQVTVFAIPPTPDITDISTLNPTVCGGNDGEFSIAGLVQNSNYTIGYEYLGNSFNTAVTSNGSGVVFVTGLESGSYGNIVITDQGGCSSDVYVGPINLSDPGAPDAPSDLEGIPNPVCLGNNVVLSVLDNPNATYTWTASSNDAGLTSSSTSSTTMTPIVSGIYTIDVTQTVAGCTSPAAMIQVIVSAVPPTPTINDISSINPTSCAVNNGSFSISGLVSGIVYEISYDFEGSQQTTTETADNSGIVTIGNLPAGSYSNIIVTSPGNCSSGTYSGPIILDGPSVPNAPSGLAADPNPVCLGAGVSLSVDNNPNATYTWTASSNDAGLEVSITNTTNLLAIAAGVYTISVTQTVNGCEGPASTIDVTVIENPITPDINSIILVNPNCEVDDGMIRIGGYNPSELYTIYYAFEGNNNNVDVTADGTGWLIINNLAAGIYSDFAVSNTFSCTSGTMAGPLELLSPTPPDAPQNLVVSPLPACVGNPLSISVIGENNAEFYWSISPDNGDFVYDLTNTASMTPTTPGVYTLNVYQRINGCNSLPTTLDFTVELDCSGSIASYVWLDTNGDGIHESSEVGIEGVTVTLYNKDNEERGTTITDENGYYLFENIASDSYYVHFVTVEPIETTFPNIGNELDDSDIDNTNGPGTTELFLLEAGIELNTIKGGFYICSKIGDNVWYDINENDVFDDIENGINGLYVSLWRYHFGEWVIWDVTETDHNPLTPSDDGHYNFCAPPGTYYVEIAKPLTGLVRARPFIGNDHTKDSDINNANGPGTTNSFSLLSGQNKLDLGAGYYPMAEAGNLVWFDANDNGLQDLGEPKIQGIKVEAFDANTFDLVGESITGLDGTYRIEDIEKIDVFLKFTIPDNLGATIIVDEDDSRDSDVDHSYGLNTTRMFSMQPGIFNEHIDLGLAFTVLPVTWLSVGVEKTKQNENDINWVIEQEVNVSHYVVERKIEGEKQFRTVSPNINALNYKNVGSYNFIDKATDSYGKYFYRIKQYDYDGIFSYSDITSINHEEEFNIEMYPNPSINTTRFEYVSLDEGQIEVELYNVEGLLVLSKKHVIKDNHLSNNFNLDISQLPLGVYNVLIKLNNNTIRKKLVKIN